MKPELTIGNRASYLKISEPRDKMTPVRTKKLGNGLYIDIDGTDKVVGIEILSEVLVKFYDDYVKKIK